jgi:hypothetical protein
MSIWVAAMLDRIERHRVMARCMYDPLVVGYWLGHVDQPGAWRADGEVGEPYEVELSSSPGQGAVTMTVDGPDVLDANPEWWSYWAGVPDFHVDRYQVFPHERGWVCRMVFRGTATDGVVVVVHQVDFATVDDRGRVVMLERCADPDQWLRVRQAARRSSLVSDRRQS